MGVTACCRCSLLLVLLLGLGLAPVAAGQEAGSSVVIPDEVREDVYLAGGTVDVLAPVRGDVVAAGGRIAVDGAVDGDVLAVGGSITIRGPVGDDVRAAGGEVRVLGPVADGLLAAGGSVIVGPQAVVGGRTALAGGRVEIAGRLEGPLRAGGGRLVLSGEILGDVELVADHVELLPGARLHGNLHYRSPRAAAIDPQAEILGTITHQPTETPTAPAAPPRGAVITVLAASLAATGVALYLLFPAFSLAGARSVGAAPWHALGLGLAVLATTPLVILLLGMTLLGMWLALMLAAAYLVTLLAGLLTGILYLGDRGLRLARRAPLEPGRAAQALAFIVALIAVLLLSRVPLLGPLALLVLWLLGIGALVLAVHARYRAGGAPPSAAASATP
ncbi:hypothetical protein HUS23_02090 [Ectothiorhodospiraceae bacterium 2226]|nr:hypothetical protein HUS23_02090 [Ectothiorhodospiraceae bacterium 2226]